MGEHSSIECNSIRHHFHKTPNIYQNISNDQQFRLNQTNEIKDCFIAKIKERELMSKNLSKYITSFDYLNKTLIALSLATGSISIASIQPLLDFSNYRICKKVFKNGKK